TDQFIVLVADRVDFHGRPESAAVLADTPAFGFVMAVARGRLENPRRHARHPIFPRVEFRKMLPDDFRCGIALQPLGAGIPVHDDPARIEHVDGAILDRLDQQPKFALAFIERLLRRAALGHIATDVCETDGAAAPIADRLDDGGRPEPAAILAYEPTLFLGAPDEARVRKKAGRVGCLVFAGEKRPEMLASCPPGRPTHTPLP